MVDTAHDVPVASNPPEVDFRALYDAHPDYVARRRDGSYAQAQVDLEVKLFKLPNLLRVLPAAQPVESVLEIGCATGELIAAMPVRQGGRRIGIDISNANVLAARARFPDVEFRCGDFCELTGSRFDVVILSDVLEHVPDDAAFLRDAAALANIVLLNLPLEDNWLNRHRHYGPDDVSGHLRRYSLSDGEALMGSAGLDVLAQARVWVHETAAEPALRRLRRKHEGASFGGSWPGRLLRRAVHAAAVGLPPFGRRLFASNLFVAARARAHRESGSGHVR